MTPQEFIASGKRAEYDYEFTLSRIEAAYDNALIKAERAYHAKLKALREKREVAISAAKETKYKKESEDYDALLNSGYTYEEVKRLRGDEDVEAAVDVIRAELHTRNDG